MPPKERDIVVDVKITSDSRGAKEAAGELEKVDKAAGKAGKSMKTMTADAKGLNEEIVRSAARIRELGAEFQATGEKSTLIDLKRERSKLGELKKLLAEAVPSGGGIDSLPRLAGVSPMVVAGVSGAVLAAAPAISAGLAAAVLGGVGIGGVVGGAVLAARDERVKTAWKDLGHTMLEQLQPAQNAFVDPIIEAANTLGDAFQDSGIVQALVEASALVDPLARSIGGFVRELGPGLAAAFKGAQPVIEELARDLPKMGKALSLMFKDMASIGPEGAAAMRDFFKVLNDGIETTGAVVKALGKIYPVIRPLIEVVPVFGLAQVLAKISHEGEGTKVTLTGIGEAAKNTAPTMAELAAQAEAVANELHSVNDEFLTLMGVALDASAATDAMNQDIIDLVDSVRENGNSLDSTTEAGIRNRDMLRGLAQDAENVYQKNIAAGMGAEEASAIYRDQMRAAEALALQLGFAADGVAELIGQWKNMPTVVSTEYRIHYQETTGGAGGGEHSGLGDVRGRKAAGGPVEANQGYIVGEEGPEYFVPSSNGYIVPNGGGGDKSGAAGWAAGWGGGGATMGAAPFVYGGNNRFEAALIEDIRTAVAARGGTLAVLGLRA